MSFFFLCPLRFAHVFSEKGKYVFVDSAVPEWSAVVVVSEEGTECSPRAAVFQPMTPAQLVKHGVVKQHRLNLLPDWGVLTGVNPYVCQSRSPFGHVVARHFVMIRCLLCVCVGILSLLLAVVVVLTTTVLVLQHSKAKLVSQWRTKPKWRSLGEPFCPVECVASEDRFVGVRAGLILFFMHDSEKNPTCLWTCLCFSITVPGIGDILCSRGLAEGAEAEEPAISKGGNSFLLLLLLHIHAYNVCLVRSDVVFVWNCNNQVQYQ